MTEHEKRMCEERKARSQEYGKRAAALLRTNARDRRNRRVPRAVRQGKARM